MGLLLLSGTKSLPLTPPKKEGDWDGASSLCRTRKAYSEADRSSATHEKRKLIKEKEPKRKLTKKVLSYVRLFYAESIGQDKGQWTGQILIYYGQ